MSWQEIQTYTGQNPREHGNRGKWQSQLSAWGICQPCWPWAPVFTASWSRGDRDTARDSPSGTSQKTLFPQSWDPREPHLSVSAWSGNIPSSALSTPLHYKEDHPAPWCTVEGETTPMGRWGHKLDLTHFAAQTLTAWVKQQHSRYNVAWRDTALAVS